jgi:hypothetical protein
MARPLAAAAQIAKSDARGIASIALDSTKAELVRAAKICSNPPKQTDQPMAIAHTTNIAPITARAIAAEGASRGLLLLLIRP